MPRTITRVLVPEGEMMEFLAPRGSEILLVGSEYDNATLSFWVLGDTNVPRVRRKVMAFSAGDVIPPKAGKYIGTLSMWNSVHHFFDGGEE